LRGNDPDPMPCGLEATLPIEGTGTGFDSNRARRERLNFGHQPVAPHASLQDEVPFGVLPVQLEDVLRQINPEECHFHVPSPFG